MVNVKRIDLWIEANHDLSPYLVIALTKIFENSDGQKTIDAVTKEELTQYRFVGLRGWDKLQILIGEVKPKRKLKLKKSKLTHSEIDAANKCMVDLMNYYYSKGDPENWINFAVLKKIITHAVGEQHIAVVLPAGDLEENKSIIKQEELIKTLVGERNKWRQISHLLWGDMTEEQKELRKKETEIVAEHMK